MQKITEHANENAKKYARMILKSECADFQGKVNRALHSGSRQDIACVTILKTAIENPYREDWAPNDRIVGIIRNGILRTVMLSRESQINYGHLRVDRIVQ